MGLGGLFCFGFFDSWGGIFGLVMCSGKGYTALILASENGHLYMVKLLLQHKANIKAKDNYGMHEYMYC